MNPNFMDRFAVNPTRLNSSRSTFDRSTRYKTSFNEGKLVPFFIDEVLPGDTFNLHTSSLVRLSNPAVRPVMDDMYLDIYYFFVPSRLIWSHFEEQHGANKSTFWTQPTEFLTPVEGTSTAVLRGSFLDYAGVNLGVSPQGVSVLPYAGYVRIWNEWFRDENLQSPLSVSDTVYAAGSGASVGTSEYDPSSILSVSRYHDYFSSCLPSPQKGAAVAIPLGTSAPVTITNIGAGPLSVSGPSGLVQGGTAVVNFASSNSTGALSVNNGNNSLYYSSGILSSGIADLSNATAANINSLRLAFQLQKLFERDARGGTRYPEQLQAHFGVTNGDARMQRPEFLGGSHVLLNMTQVQQTAPGTSSAVGSLGAYSLTGSRDGSFVKSFTEFGYVYGLACVRVKHSYSQGIPRLFTRKRRFDYYYPALANLGEQPVYQRELYASGMALSNTNVFGFQEAWAEYRYKPDLVTGMLRPGVTADMTAWTFGDNYTAAPTLSAGWVVESASNIDQTLAVPSATADQFIADFGILNKCTRVMPLYSVPGLIDHN